MTGHTGHTDRTDRTDRTECPECPDCDDLASCRASTCDCDCHDTGDDYDHEDVVARRTRHDSGWIAERFGVTR